MNTNLLRAVSLAALCGALSGCVTNETALLSPTTTDLALQNDQAVQSDQAIESPVGSDQVPESGVALVAQANESGIPVPAQNGETITAAYAPTPSNKVVSPIATAQASEQIIVPQTSTQPTLAQGIAGGVLTQAQNAGVNSTNNVAQSRSLFSAQRQNTQNLAKRGGQSPGLFSRLFKKRDNIAAQPETAVISNVAAAEPETLAEVESAQPVAMKPEPLAKEQITELKGVKAASTTPIVETKPKRPNLLKSFFGKIKNSNSASKLAEKKDDLIELASLGGLARLSPTALKRQTERVDVACLKPELVRLLKKVEKHYNSPVIVTSGYRSPNRNKRIGGASGSRHTTCEAADVQIKGVSKWELAKYVRSMPDRGGVGTYCHTQSVHIDIGSVRDWNWRCRKRK